MPVQYKGIDRLPSVSNVAYGDKLAVSHNGITYKADASLFRGDPATINGENALIIQAGANITMTQQDGNVTISAQDTTYTPATTAANGLMSANDKAKLDGMRPLTLEEIDDAVTSAYNSVFGA